MYPSGSAVEANPAIASTTREKSFSITVPPWQCSIPKACATRLKNVHCTLVLGWRCPAVAYLAIAQSRSPPCLRVRSVPQFKTYLFLGCSDVYLGAKLVGIRVWCTKTLDELRLA